MSERNETETKSALAAQSTYLNKGKTMFDVNECERCACEVKDSQTLCMDCMVSVPMFEQSTSFNSVLDMLIQAEESTVYTTV